MNTEFKTAFSGYRKLAMTSAVNSIRGPIVTDNVVLTDEWKFRPVVIEDSSSQVELEMAINVSAPNIYVYYGRGITDKHPEALAIHYAAAGKRTWLIVPDQLLSFYAEKREVFEEAFLRYGDGYEVPKTNRVTIISNNSFSNEFTSIIGPSDALIFVDCVEDSMTQFFRVLESVEVSEKYASISVMYTDCDSEESVMVNVRAMSDYFSFLLWKNLVLDINAELPSGDVFYEVILSCGPKIASALGTSDPGVYTRSLVRLEELSYEDVDVPLQTSCYAFSLGSTFSLARYTVYVYPYKGDLVVRSCASYYRKPGTEFDETIVPSAFVPYSRVTTSGGLGIVQSYFKNRRIPVVRMITGNNGTEKKESAQLESTMEMVGCSLPVPYGYGRRLRTAHEYDPGFVRFDRFSDYYSQFNMSGHELLSRSPAHMHMMLKNCLFQYSRSVHTDSRYCWLQSFDTVIHHQLMLDYPPLLLLHQFQTVVFKYHAYYHGHYVVQETNDMYFHITYDKNKYIPPSAVAGAWSFRDLKDCLY